MSSKSYLMTWPDSYSNSLLKYSPYSHFSRYFDVSWVHHFNSFWTKENDLWHVRSKRVKDTLRIFFQFYNNFSYIFITGAGFDIRCIRVVTWYFHLLYVTEVTTATHFYPGQETQQVEKSWLGAGQHFLISPIYFLFLFWFCKYWCRIFIVTILPNAF